MRRILTITLIILMTFRISAKEISTRIIIQASPEKVWTVLTAFSDYGKWNPFITKISGDLIRHKKLHVTLSPPDSKTVSFKPKLLVNDPAHQLSWIGHLLIPGLFDGHHIFELIDNHDGSTTFIQREVFKGILVGFFRKKLDTDIRNGFESMNKKLQEICEQS